VVVAPFRRTQTLFGHNGGGRATTGATEPRNRTAGVGEPSPTPTRHMPAITITVSWMPMLSAN